MAGPDSGGAVGVRGSWLGPSGELFGGEIVPVLGAEHWRRGIEVPVECVHDDGELVGGGCHQGSFRVRRVFHELGKL